MYREKLHAMALKAMKQYGNKVMYDNDIILAMFNYV